MLQLLSTGMPYREVALTLYKSHGLTTKQNNPVSGEQVRRWLFNKFHDGMYDFA